MNDNRRNIVIRLTLMIGILLLIPFVIGFQLFRIHFIEGENLRALWSAQAVDFVPIPAQRGQIYDRNLNVLVSNTVTYNVAVDPLAPGTTKFHIDTLCTVLGKVTSRSKAELMKRVSSAPNGSRYIVLAKNLNSRAYEDVAALDFRGLIIEQQYRRKYNYDSLSAHVLGYVNRDVRGMSGLEAYYDEVLRGKNGIQQVQRDRNNQIRAIVGAPKKKPSEGYSLKSTIDLQIQAIVEEELRQGILLNKAKHGTAIVLDVESGAVLAMANYPTYNPNWPGAEDENRRNFAISDMIEPGSTFKLVTAIAAVEQNKVSFDEKFETPIDGKKLIHGQWMRDHDPLGTLTFPEVIQKSSNVATAEIAQRLSREALYQYARNLGFATETHIDLPHEETGRLRKPYEWSLVSLPWIAMGYEVQVTPLQIAQAYGAFANGGKMMRPYIISEIIDDNGNTIQKNEPTFVRQVARPETIEKLLPIFESVVSDSGTAVYAQLDRISVAGKTGTAQKFENGKYQTKYRASFVGFFPSRKPKYVTLVLLEEPKRSIYGGFTCGPIFKNVAERIAGMDNSLLPMEKNQPDDLFHIVPHLEGMLADNAQALLSELNIDFESTGKGNVIATQSIRSGEKLASGEKLIIALADAGQAEGDESLSYIVPDMIGQSMRQSTYMLIQNGYEVEKIGSGTVFAQFPKAGTAFRKGGKVIIRGKAKSMEITVSEVRK